MFSFLKSKDEGGFRNPKFDKFNAIMGKLTLALLVIVFFVFLFLSLSDSV